MLRALNMQRTVWISILLISTASALGREDRFAQLSEQLNKSTADPDVLNEWSDLALDSGKFEAWNAVKPNINRGQIPSQMLTPQAYLLFAWELDTADWVSLSKLAHSSGIDKFQWRLAGHLRTKLLDDESRRSALSLGHPALEKLNPDTEEDSTLVLMLTGSFILFMLCVMALARRLRRDRIRLQQDLPTPEIISQLKELLKSGSEPQRYQIALSELELSLRHKAIEEAFKNKSLWNQLSEKQRLLLFLVVKGHAAKDCADYFEVSLGHWYNQRSELRSLCGLNEEESFDQLFVRSTNVG